MADRPSGFGGGGEGMIVRLETRGVAIIMMPEGEIDLTASPVLRQELKKVQSQRPPPQKLVIDLSLVPYMDSSGVATLVEAMQMARKNSTRLVLCAMQDKVRSIFEIARLDTVFAIVADANTAIAH